MRRLRRRLRDERGFSLVELLVAMSILGVVLGGVSLLLVRGGNAESDLNARFQAQQGARTALDRLRRDVHCASAVAGSAGAIALTVPAGCGGAAGTVRWCAVGAGPYELYRQVGAVCGSGGVRWADSLLSASLFTIGAQSTSTLALVTVDLHVRPRARQALDDYELQDTLVLRNSTRS